MSKQIREPSSEEVDAAAAILRMLADPTRLRIIWALLHGEHAVNDLADHVGAQPAAVSQHLAKLRLSRLVDVRRDGNRMFYAANNEHVRRLATEALFQAGVTEEQSVGDHHARRAAQ